jgi:hypothetical protein
MSKKEIVIVVLVICVICFLIGGIVNSFRHVVETANKRRQGNKPIVSTNLKENLNRFHESGYSWEDQEIEQMKYRVYFGQATGHGPNSIFVVNVTKDKLEVEALQKQLK